MLFLVWHKPCSSAHLGYPNLASPMPHLFRSHNIIIRPVFECCFYRHRKCTATGNVLSLVHFKSRGCPGYIYSHGELVVAIGSRVNSTKTVNSVGRGPAYQDSGKSHIAWQQYINSFLVSRQPAGAILSAIALIRHPFRRYHSVSPPNGQVASPIIMSSHLLVVRSS